MKKVMALVLVCAMMLFSAISVSAADAGKYTPVIDGEKDAAYNETFSFGIFDQEGIEPGEGFYSTYGDATATLDAKAYYLWDDQFLYVYVEVTDDDPTDAGSGYVLEEANPWESEAAELWTLFEDLDEGGLFNKTSTELFSGRFWGEGANFDDMVAGGSKVAVKRTDSGYAAEFALAIPGGLKSGQKIKTALQVNDFSSEGTNAIGKQINAGNTDELMVIVLGAEIKIEVPAQPEPEPEPEPEPVQDIPAAVVEAPIVTTTGGSPQTGDITALMGIISLMSAGGFSVFMKTKKRK